MAGKPIVVFERYGIQPELRLFRVALDVNVGRFVEKIMCEQKNRYGPFRKNSGMTKGALALKKCGRSA